MLTTFSSCDVIEIVCLQDEDDDDDDLDDEAMLKIDAALGRAFQARKKSLSTKKERKGSIIECTCQLFLLYYSVSDFQHQLMDFRLR